MNIKLHTGLLLLVTGLLFSSCRKENVALQLRTDALQKITGQWEISRTVNEEYFPITVFQSGKTLPGNADDNWTFNTDMSVEINDVTSGRVVYDYEVINPYQVRIGDKYWRIERLTETELILLRDVNDVTIDKRYVTRIYFQK